jgi:hypothetical protein
LPEVVAGWVRGESYDALREVLTQYGASTAVKSKLVSSMTDLASIIGWGAGSLLSVARDREDEIPDVAPLLPYNIRFGVESPVAAYLRLLGVTDRSGAVRLAQEYPADGVEDFASVASWVRSPTARRLIHAMYAESRILQSTIEGDLGLEEDAATSHAIAVTLPGEWPLWVRPGALLWATEGSLVDRLGDRTTDAVEALPVEGMFAVVARDEAAVSGWAIRIS